MEALLRVAAESYKRNVGREEAQQIIHAFAIMKPSGGDDSSDDLLDTDDTSTNQEDNDDSSEASEDAEEKAYLRDIQESTDKITPFNITSDTPTRTLHSNTTTPYGSPDQARKTPTLTRSRLEQHQQQQQQQQQQIRPGSVASIQTMVTAPATPRQLPAYANRPPSVANSLSSGVRPRSAVSSRLGQYGSSTRGNEKKPAHMTRDDLRVLPQKSSYQEPEFIDVNVNPWQHIPANRPGVRQQQQQQQQDSGASSSSGNESDHDRRGTRSRSRTPNANERYLRKASSSSHLRLPSPMYQQQQQARRPHLTSPSPPPSYAAQQPIHGMTPIHTSGSQFQSPVPGSSASSSVTATPQNNMLSSMSEGRASRNNNNRHFTFANTESHVQQPPPQSHQHISTLALGPATKRALESLQNDVVALNDRIDDLRRELVERDKQQRVRSNNNQESGGGEDEDDSDSSYDMGEGWRWVIKVCTFF